MTDERSKPQTERESPFPGRIEIGVLAVVGVALAAALVPFAAGPVLWDDLLYLRVATIPEPFGWILNRYFHIYFVRLFVVLFGSALLGVRVYWGVMYATTAICTYLIGRAIAPSHRRVAGVLAATVFFAHQPILDTIGGPLADFTVMLLFAVACFLALIAVGRTGSTRLVLIAAIGTLIFLAAKSKETAIVLPLLALAFGRDDSGVFTRRRLRDDALALMAGGIIGAIVMTLLDWINLGDPFYWIRPSAMSSTMSFNTSEGPDRRAAISWISHGFVSYRAIPFYLYILAFFRGESERPVVQKVLWAIPLALLIFLSLTSLRGRWTVVIHYVYPAIPLIAAFAALPVTGGIETLSGRLLEWKPDWSRHKKIVPWTVLAGTLIAGIVLYRLYRWTALIERFEWEKEDFQAAIFFPIVAFALLLALGLEGKRHLIAPPVILLAFWLGVWPPLAEGYQNLAERKIAQQVEKRYYPFREFADEFQFTGTEKVYVSKHLKEKEEILEADINRFRWLFITYFNRDMGEENFAFDHDIVLIAREPFDYAFIQPRELYELKQDYPGAFDAIAERYEVIEDSQGLVTLLKLKGSTMRRL